MSYVDIQKVFLPFQSLQAGLNTLCERKSSFIFTSHLHELTKLEELKSLNNLEIFRLKIDYDRVNDILIYDRKLEKGSIHLFMV